MKKQLLASTAIAAAVGLVGYGFAGSAGKAQAAMTDNMYFGAGALVASHTGQEVDEATDSLVRGVELGAKVFAGYQFSDYGAVEAGYTYYGEADNTSTHTFEEQAVNFSLLGILPVGNSAEAYFRIGALYGWQTNHSPESGTETHGGWSPVFALGANLNVTESFAVRMEGEYVENIGGDNSCPSSADVDILSFSLNAMYRF